MDGLRESLIRLSFRVKREIFCGQELEKSRFLPAVEMTKRVLRLFTVKIPTPLTLALSPLRVERGCFSFVGVIEMRS
jgi:hypothetical protein